MTPEQISMFLDIVGYTVVIALGAGALWYAWRAFCTARVVSEDLYVLLRVLERKGAIPSRAEINAEIEAIDREEAAKRADMTSKPKKVGFADAETRKRVRHGAAHGG